MRERNYHPVGNGQRKAVRMCYPCLWQANSKGYRNVRAKDNACREVSVQTLLRRIITYRAKTSAIFNLLLRSRSMGDRSVHSQITTRAYFVYTLKLMRLEWVWLLTRWYAEIVNQSVTIRDATHRYATCDQHHIVNRA